MRDLHLSLHELHGRVEHGDAGAVRELRRRLEPILAGMVRRTLCVPSERSWLKSLVEAEISRVDKRGFDEKMADDRSLVAHIVTCIAGPVMEQLRIGIDPPPTNRETVRNLSVRSLAIKPCNLGSS